MVWLIQAVATRRFIARARPVIRDARGVRSCYDSVAFTESTGNRYVFLPVPAWPGPVADRVRLL